MESVYKDDLEGVPINFRPDTVVEDALLHFNIKVHDWIYPAKSYFVAICYAKWIEKDFKEDFYTVLDDADLIPKDPYFRRYSQDKETYDAILKRLEFNEDKGMCPDVREYYHEEMLFDKL
jgi:hypothetical protein|tara:strand:- start:2866 stop:3225 length:360 start_codon:yes stop_codon:yes gene_type:complete